MTLLIFHNANADSQTSMPFYFYANGYILQYKFLYWNEMLLLFFYGKCKLKSEEQKCNKWTEKKKKFKCVILQHRQKKKRPGIIYETFILFSLMYFIYLFITAINADGKAVRVKPTISLTSTNENPSICMTVRVMAPLSRTDCEGSFKDGLKTHILNPPVQRDANKPYRSYLITTRKCAPSLTA